MERKVSCSGGASSVQRGGLKPSLTKALRYKRFTLFRRCGECAACGRTTHRTRHAGRALLPYRLRSTLKESPGAYAQRAQMSKTKRKRERDQRQSDAISTAFTSYFRQRGPGTRLVRSPSSSTHPQRGRLRRRHTTRRGRSARWARSAGRRGRRAPWRRARSCPR